MKDDDIIEEGGQGDENNMEEDFVPDLEGAVVPKPIGKIRKSVSSTLESKLKNRINPDDFSSKFIASESVREAMANRQDHLQKHLQKRPSKKTLVKNNVMKNDAYSAFAANQDALLKGMKKDKLSALLVKRPSQGAMRKKNLIMDVDAREQKANDSLSKKLELNQLLEKRSSWNSLQQKGILRSAEEAGHDDRNSRISEKKHTREETANQLTPKKVNINFKAVSVQCGWGHTTILSDQGELHGCGRSEEGRLGSLGNAKQVVVPVVIPGIGKVSAFSCGDNHTAAVCDGKLYTWGVGTWGRLGLGHQQSVNTPTPVAIDGVVVRVDCAAYHTLVLTDKKELYGFGWNKGGRVGSTSEETVIAAPEKLEWPELAGKQIVNLATGMNVSFVVTAEREVYSWGSGTAGCTGHKDTNDRYGPQLVQDLQGQKVVSVVCGASHTMALTSDGKVLSWGLNNDCQLGRKTPNQQSAMQPTVIPDLEGIKLIAAGRSQSFAISDDAVYVWGNGSYGLLATGHEKTVETPTKVEFPDRVVAVNSGWIHTGFVTAGGEVYTVGNTKHGKLGYLLHD